MSKIAIKNIFARQILDSRGNPTVEVMVETSKGAGVFGVPSGASTGSAEALELRDGGQEFGGKGVGKAVDNVNNIIAKKIKGMDVFAQAEIDGLMGKLDGTLNKSKLGANAILGVSGAVLKAAAASKKIPLYKFIAGLHKNKKLVIPKIMSVVIEGGLHGDTNINFQEFMIVPEGRNTFERLRIVSEIFHSLEEVLKGRKLPTNLGNEGAYSPKVESNRQALDFIFEAAKLAGWEPGKDFNLALDVAASEFYKQIDEQYVLSADRTSLNAERLVSLLKEWAAKYSIISIEDILAEEDWSNWQKTQARFDSNMMLVGDDLFVTQKERLQKGIELGVGNATIVKPNQVGSITETLQTVKLAQDNNYKVIVSHRAGETNDDFIADFAVGIGADFIKAGSVARGERVAKYNRLLAIELMINS